MGSKSLQPAKTDPFQVSVISSSVGSREIRIPNDLDLSHLARYDEEATKAALLYADNVTLHSFRETVRKAFWLDGHKRQFGMAAFRLYLGTLVNNSDEWIEQNLGMDPRLIPDKELIRKSPNLSENASWDSADYLTKHSDVIFEMAERYAEYLRPGFESMDSPTLRRIQEAGLLTVVPWHKIPTPIVLPGPELFRRGFRDIGPTLDSLKEPIFVDPTSLSFSRRLKSSHRRKPSSGDTIRALMETVASRLPGFENADLIEIMDIREDLREFLVPFRAELISLAQEIDSADEESLQDVVVNTWHSRIAPIVDELNYETRRSRYLRELLGIMAEGRDALVSAAALTVSVTAVASGMNVLLPAAASAGYPFVKALHQTMKAHELARKNRLIFLQKVARKLAG